MTELTMPQRPISEMVFAPTWDRQPLEISQTLDVQRRLFVVPPNQPGLVESLNAELPDGANVVVLDEAGIESAVQFAANPQRTLTLASRMAWTTGIDDEAINAVFSLLKRLLGLAQVTIELVVFKAIRNPAVESVTFPADGIFVGLFQTLLKEHPTWNVRTLVLNQASPENLSRVLSANLPLRHPQPIGISADSAYFANMSPANIIDSVQDDVAQHSSTYPSAGFKQRGHYLIIGGNGGIGSLLAKHLATKYHANLMLVSRRSNADACEELRALGATSAVSYSLDLCDETAVTEVFTNITQLDGVIHSALVLKDAAMTNMDADTLFAVLRPKVHGARNLLNAIKHRSLDFCLFFSSIQSFIANAGQANYSAACVAKDAFAEVLHQTFMHNTKVVNWAFWGNVGIVAKPEYREIMQRREIGSIEADEGLSIIEHFLTSPLRQITVIKASDKALRSLDIEPHSSSKKLEPNTVADTENRAETAQVLAKHIIPDYSLDNPQVRYNESMSAHLQAYSRWLISTIPLPDKHVPAFDKLVSAIRAMKPDTSPSREQLIEKFPELTGHIKLVDTCLSPLPQILTGETDPLSIMFPEGSFHLVEPVYRDNPIADYFNQKASEIVQAFQRRVQRPIRILEIGAGTGSTTQFVLPKLDATTALYTFTDLSFAFLNKARKRFADYPFMEYKICNIESPPEFDVEYDVIVATNVIHATADLPKVLANVRSVMSDDGIFVLNEITSLQDYATLTFGLTEGWWLSIDPYRIPNSPLLTGATWQQLMRDVGFSHTDAHGSDDQQVIVGFTRAATPTSRVAMEHTADAPPAANVVSQDEVIASPATETEKDAAISAQLDEQWVQQYISKIIAEIMHFDEEIDPQLPFNELGIDSLIALELLKPLKDDLGYIPTTVLFEYPTLARLAAHFLADYFQPLTELFNAQKQNTQVQEAIQPDAMNMATVADSQVLASAVNDELSQSNNDANQVKAPTSIAQSADVIAAQVASVIADVMMMSVDDIHPKVPFNEYGIDSLIALELLKPLREQYGYLPATLLFEYPTLQTLAEYLATLAPASTVEASESDNETGHKDTVTANAEPAASPESTTAREDVAIVGLSAKMPQVSSLDAFWEQLAAGESLTTDLPEERWNGADFAAEFPLTQRGSYSQRAAFLLDIDAFDHQFFRLTPAEAERMDPQERLFLQQCYHTMLDAGMPQHALQGSDTGVYVGVMNGGYQWHEPKDDNAQPPTSLFWSIANRASYIFGWHGPSMAIDTACSSSLTALHLACQALRAGECEQAIVAGVNIIAHPRHFELLCGLHMLSPTETCKPFGINADGFVDGEGIIAVMLQPLAAAQQQGRRIHGIVKGSAVNAGGQSNGYTAPNPDAQRKVIEKALTAAKVAPSEISYVEAHGTGTELGDPIELRALTQAYADSNRPAETKIALGSVKSNIGHLESAAGLSGLVKVLLQMQHNTLVPSINAQTINPHLKMHDTPFMLVQQKQAWNAQTKMAGISSFGAGGANAHVIIAQAPQAVSEGLPLSSTPVSLVLSHHTATGLQQRLDDLAAWLETNAKEPNLLALAYRLSALEDQHSERVSLVVHSVSELRQQLLLNLPELRQIHGNFDAQALAFIKGETVDWQQVWEAKLGSSHLASLQQAALLLDLPTYPFTPSRHWVDSTASNFKRIDSLVSAHRINNTCIAPAAWSVAEAIERGLQQTSAQNTALAISNVIWQAKIEQPEAVNVTQEGKQLSFTVAGKSVCQVADIQGAVSSNTIAVQQKEIHTHRISGQEIYQRFAAEGYHYGRYLQAIRRVDIGRERVEAFLAPTHDWGYAVSPALIDSLLQLAMLMPRQQQSDATLLPYSMGRCELFKLPENLALYATCSERVERSQGAIRCFDFELRDEQNQLVMRIEELISVVVDEVNNAQSTASPAANESANVQLNSVEVYDL